LQIQSCLVFLEAFLEAFWKRDYQSHEANAMPPTTRGTGSPASIDEGPSKLGPYRQPGAASLALRDP